MTFRTIKLSAIAVLLFILFLAPGMAPTTENNVNATPTLICQPPWEYAGCWRSSPQSECLDRWRDASGRFWLSGPCGSLEEPICGNRAFLGAPCS
jgi:hypothetical protein